MHERKEKNKRFDENFKNTNIYHIHARWKRQKRIIKKNIPLLLLLQKNLWTLRGLIHPSAYYVNLGGGRRDRDVAGCDIGTWIEKKLNPRVGCESTGNIVRPVRWRSAHIGLVCTFRFVSPPLPRNLIVIQVFVSASVGGGGVSPSGFLIFHVSKIRLSSLLCTPPWIVFTFPCQHVLSYRNNG